LRSFASSTGCKGAREAIAPRYHYLPLFTLRDFGIEPPPSMPADAFAFHTLGDRSCGKSAGPRGPCPSSRRLLPPVVGYGDGFQLLPGFVDFGFQGFALPFKGFLHELGNRRIKEGPGSFGNPFFQAFQLGLKDFSVADPAGRESRSRIVSSSTALTSSRRTFGIISVS
jgi:hypothetical protein